METIVDFFVKNRELLADFIDKIKVNHEKTIVKFGSKADQNISISFFIHGELQQNPFSYEDKIERLFDTNEDLHILDQLISEIDLPYHFSFGPFLKISKDNEPLIHAFHITILFNQA